MLHNMPILVNSLLSRRKNFSKHLKDYKDYYSTMFSSNISAKEVSHQSIKLGISFLVNPNNKFKRKKTTQNKKLNKGK